MTDREMLEFAAKAAGLRVRTWEGHSGTMCAIDDDRHGHMWMPLADGGDALRLAVKLRMSVTVFDNAVGIGIKGDFGYREYDITPDPHAAACRAITSAAAEIGKAMP